MSDADWYARKLGGQAPVQRPSSTPRTDAVLPRYTQPPPGYLPAGTNPLGYEEDETPPLSDAPPGSMHIMDGVMRWRGGKGTKTEAGACPSCGGKNFFSRKEAAKVTPNGMALPAPSCFDCGYNGVYAPFGGDLNSV